MFILLTQCTVYGLYTSRFSYNCGKLFPVSHNLRALDMDAFMPVSSMSVKIDLY